MRPCPRRLTAAPGRRAARSCSGRPRSATTAAAIAAAVVAWRADLGQEQARVADALVIAACCVGRRPDPEQPPAAARRAHAAGRRRRLGPGVPAGRAAGRAPRGRPRRRGGRRPARGRVHRPRPRLAGAGRRPAAGLPGRRRTATAVAAARRRRDSGCSSSMIARAADDRSTTASRGRQPARAAGRPRGGRRMAPSWSSSPSARSAWSPAWSRWPRRWRTRQPAGPPAGRLVRARARASRSPAPSSSPPGSSGAPVFSLAVAALPVAVGVAVLQHRLYEVDVLVNRALLYALLTSVGGRHLRAGRRPASGAMLNERGAGWLPWLATAAVAVAFQPLREAIQRGVNRLTYGAWDDPQALVRSLHARLEQAARPSGRSPTSWPRRATRCAWTTSPSRPPTAASLASAGEPADDAGRRLPLVHAGTRRRRAASSPAAGAGAGTTRRSPSWPAPSPPPSRRPGCTPTSLRSRERLVVAREEERRRLRRDLHDGLGPALAGLTLKLDTARNLLGDAPAAAGDARATSRPRSPTSAGWSRGCGRSRWTSSAWPRRCGGWSTGRRRTARVVQLVTDGADSPAAAVEVAAYRIVQEALTNVLRHSGAHSCDVSVCGRERLAGGQRRRRRPRAAATPAAAGRAWRRCASAPRSSAARWNCSPAPAAARWSAPSCRGTRRDHACWSSTTIRCSAPGSPACWPPSRTPRSWRRRRTATPHSARRRSPGRTSS